MPLKAQLNRLALGTLTALPLAASADETTLTPVADATIHSQDGHTASGAGQYLFVGRINNTPVRRALLRFDTSTIPAGSTINSVSLTILMNRTTNGSQACSLHRLTTGWTEGASMPAGEEGGGAVALQDDVTWEYTSYNSANPPASPTWNTPGGDYNASPSDTIPVSSAGQGYTWTSAQMALDVQHWVDTPAENFGWIIVGVESTPATTKRFISRHHPNPDLHPALVIDYTPPADCLADVNGDGMLSPTDFTAWVGAFNANAQECDQNNDGMCTPTDFTAWVGNYNAGC